MEPCCHLVDRPQRKGAQQQGEQGAAGQTAGSDDGEKAQNAGVLRPLGQQSHMLDHQQHQSDDQQGSQSHHKYAGGQQQGQGHAALVFLLHTFFTAL